MVSDVPVFGLNWIHITSYINGRSKGEGRLNGGIVPKNFEEKGKKSENGDNMTY